MRFQPLVFETEDLKVTVTVEAKNPVHTVRLLWILRRRLPKAIARLTGRKEEEIRPCGCSGS